MKKTILIIIVVLILAIAAAVVLYFTTDVFDSILNKEPAANTNTAAQTNTPETNTTSQNKNGAADTTQWKTYDSTAGFSFKYPADYIEYDSDQLMGFHSPEDNTDSVSFAMPQSCYDNLVAFYDANSNLDIESDITEIDIFGDEL